MIEIGIIGGALIILAWLFEMIEAVEKHKSLIDLRFIFIYLPGSVLLALYSFQIKDPIFLSLQVAIIFLVIAELFYSLKIKKVHKKR